MLLNAKNRRTLSFVPFPVQIPGTLGVDKGPGTDGVLLGALTPQAINKCLIFAVDTFTEKTTEINNATANDVTPFGATPANTDYIEFVGATKFHRLQITVGTASADLVMTTRWEYATAKDTWATLTPIVDETNGMMPTGTGVKNVIFSPPDDWVATAETGVTGTGFRVRCRCLTFTSKTTMPILSRAYLLDMSHGYGLKWPVCSKLEAVQWTAGTVSGSSADSKFLVINLTKGTHSFVTMTKALAVSQDTGLHLKVTEDDEIVIAQIQEDGSTEFADVLWWITQSM